MFRTGNANTGNAGNAATARRVKDWVREALGVGEEVTILVSELACSEPGCPPIETAVAVFRTGETAVKHTIHRPLAEVTREDIAALPLAPSPPATG